MTSLIAVSYTHLDVYKRQLLDYAKSVKKELSLSVYKKNQAAVRFYLRNGFEILSLIHILFWREQW